MIHFTKHGYFKLGKDHSYSKFSIDIKPMFEKLPLETKVNNLESPCETW